MISCWKLDSIIQHELVISEITLCEESSQLPKELRNPMKGLTIVKQKNKTIFPLMNWVMKMKHQTVFILQNNLLKNMLIHYYYESLKTHIML